MGLLGFQPFAQFLCNALKLIFFNTLTEVNRHCRQSGRICGLTGERAYAWPNFCVKLRVYVIGMRQIYANFVTSSGEGLSQETLSTRVIYVACASGFGPLSRRAGFVVKI
jgi:hypothetical protein